MGFDYEKGLGRLEQLLQGRDPQFPMLDKALRDNLRSERLFGSSPTVRSERARLVSLLNTLALRYGLLSFNSMCS